VDKSRRLWYMGLSILLIMVFIAGIFSCSKPAAPAPAPSPTAKPAPAPAPSPTVKPSPTPTGAAQVPPPGAEKINLKYAGSMPVEHVLTKGELKFKELVESRSKGVITVDVFPASQLYKDTDFPNVIPAGTIDISQGSPGKWAGIVPAVLYTNLPGIFDDYEHHFRFVDGLGYTILDRQMQKVDTKLLGYGFYGGAWGIMSNKPIKVMADIKDMKIRATDATVQTALIALGAKAVVLSSGEAYTAMQRGTIDAAMSAVSSFVERKWYEVAKNSTFFPNPTSWCGTSFPVFMSLKKWNSLQPWAQELIRQAAIDANEYTRPLAMKSDTDDTETIKSKTASYFLPQDEWAKWRAIAVKAAVDNYIETAGDAGKEILAAVEATRKK